MPVHVFKNAVVLLSGKDIAADGNKVKLGDEVELLEKTHFNDDSKEFEPGLEIVTFDYQGFVQFGEGLIDEVLHGDVGGSEEVLTVMPGSGAQGEVGFATKSIALDLQRSADHGKLLIFQIKGKGNKALVRVVCLETGTKGTSYNGTARQLGAVSSAQKLYSSLHVTAVSGGTPSLIVKVQSAPDQAFTTPTDRIVFSAVSDTGAQWGEAAGPITDQWYRAVITIAGSTPSFTLAVCAGIR